MVFCSVVMLQTTFADNDVVTTDTNQLPATARQFIRQHFQGINISHIKIESNLFGITSYDVILTNGFDLEFNKQGAWTEIDGQRKPIPVKAIPSPITEYREKHFADQSIISIDKDSNGYDVKLTNGLEIKFDPKFNFIRYDD